VAAAVALALFIALVPRASPPSTSNNSLRGNLHATSHQFLVGLLITPSFSCKIFGTWFTDFFWDAVSQFHSTRGLQPLSHLIPFSMCAFGSSFLRNLFYLIHRQGMVNRWSKSTIKDRTTGNEKAACYLRVSWNQQAAWFCVPWSNEERVETLCPSRTGFRIFPNHTFCVDFFWNYPK